MTFRKRLQLVVFPFVLMPAMLSSAVLFTSLERNLRTLRYSLLELEADSLERRSLEERAVLERLGLVSSPFYERGARDRVVAYAAGRSIGGIDFQILGADGQPVPGTGVGLGAPPVSIRELGSKRVELVYEGGKRYMGVRTALEGWEWTAFALAPYAMPREAIFGVFGPGIAILFASLFAAAFYFRHLGEQVTRPLARLAEAAGRVGLDIPRDPVPERGDLELVELARAFNDMRVRLETMKAGLEEAVAERTLELREANASLTEALADIATAQERLVKYERLAALGQLAAGVAHELNTPLGALISSSRVIASIFEDVLPTALEAMPRLGPTELKAFTDLIRHGYEATTTRQNPEAGVSADSTRSRLMRAFGEWGMEPDQATLDALESIGVTCDSECLLPLLAVEDRGSLLALAERIVSARRLLSVQNQAGWSAAKVVDSLRGYLGGNSEDESVVDVAESIESALLLIDSRIRSGVVVEKRLQRGVLVRASASRLDQVWMNLIGNAVQSMDAKGLLIISMEQSGDSVSVSVSDTGCGIPEEAKPRVFEPFFSAWPHGVGIGLGLDICRKIVESCSGTIDFESGPAGTVFTVRLPLNSPSSAGTRDINASSRS
ncbi:MAG: HAMP domain-containing protein [Spirochaetales bacterium]|nr:HAMP domain-containing protein [Spirochaetales bacterium]